jgi:hypothetical protein
MRRHPSTEKGRTSNVENPTTSIVGDDRCCSVSFEQQRWTSTKANEDKSGVDARARADGKNSSANIGSGFT